VLAGVGTDQKATKGETAFPHEFHAKKQADQKVGGHRGGEAVAVLQSVVRACDVR
jgi:hypothetical protein